jgi:hypothetical protein
MQLSAASPDESGLALTENGTSHAGGVIMPNAWVSSRPGRGAAGIVMALVEVAAFLAASVRGQTVTLAWDPSTNTDVVGYNLY